MMTIDTKQPEEQPSPRRHLVISDIHGCLEEFLEVLNLARYDETKDALIVLGDLVDRGPYSAGVVEALRSTFKANQKPKRGLIPVHTIIGNHDERYIRYHQHVMKKKQDKDYKIPMYMSPGKLKIYKSLTKDQISFMSKMPTKMLVTTATGEKWALVHAGLEPGVDLENQNPNTILHIRYLQNKKLVHLDTKTFQPPSGSVYWTEAFDHPELNVIYGHTVHSLDTPRIDLTKTNKKLLVGIDTGACFGGNLTCYTLENGEIFQVRSKECYATHSKLDDRSTTRRTSL